MLSGRGGSQFLKKIFLKPYAHLPKGHVLTGKGKKLVKYIMGEISS
jgi:hypothetical protein